MRRYTPGRPKEPLLLPGWIPLGEGPMPRPVGAGVVTVLGGLFILLGGAVIAAFGWVLSAFAGISSSLFEVGLVVGGLTVLIGILMIAVPPAHTLWGILAVLFALVAIPFALAGLVVGSVLAFVGGGLSIAWRRPPASRTITVEGRVVPPSSEG